MDDHNLDHERSAYWEKMGNLIARAVSDPGFRAELQSNDSDRIRRCLDEYAVSEAEATAWASELEHAFGEPFLRFWFFIQEDNLAS